VIRLCFILIPALVASLGWSADFSGQPPIVGSFTITTELIQVIVKQEFKVYNIVPEKSELHGYQLSARDARSLDRAPLIIGTSPSLEPWLASWVQANHRESRTVWLNPPETTSSPEQDPHHWTDPREVLKMASRLREAVTRSLPEALSNQKYEEFVREVRSVDRELAEIFGALPAANRIIITQHPNLGWFARRYGLEVAGTILASGSAEGADPSAGHYAELLALIRRKGVRVIITDEGQNDQYARRLAQDAKLPPPVALNFEYLEPRGQEGDSWASLMRKNARILRAALTRP
jgi:zinc/manganese transport system substrate-binding protein